MAINSFPIPTRTVDVNKIQEAIDSADLAQAWAESEFEPGGPGSRSAKGWAELVEGALDDDVAAAAASAAAALASEQAALASEEAALASEEAALASEEAALASEEAAALDAAATAADAIATAADRVQTGLDAAATANDVVSTSSDRVQTGLDAVATAADRVQAGLDAAAAAASAAAALASEEAALASEEAAALSESNAATSEANAATSEGNAATSASNASTSASVASTSASTATTQAGIATTQAGIATTQAAAATAAASSTGLMGRNLIINGSGRINQRGYVSGAATSGANQFTLDRWFVVTSGQNLSFTGDDSRRVMTAPAGGVRQVIEGANIVGGDYVLNWDGTATATVNGTARTKGEVFTLTANSNVVVAFASGTFTDVQLERGSVVTPFEWRPFGDELARCQRYYEKTFDYDVAPASNAGLAGSLGTTSGGAVTASAQASWHFSVAKRATPSVATFNPSASGSGWRNVNTSGVNADAATVHIGLKGLTAVISSTPQAERRYSIHVVAEAELTS